VRKSTILLIATVILAAPLPAQAALQCVTYARDVTGLNLKGDAWRWWEAADGLYDRGKRPLEGAVMVFKRQGSMRHGHVSVVRKMTDSRVVLVDHANWAPHRSAGRGKVAEAVPVMDVSPNNDWSQVRVWYRPTNSFGSKVYQTLGFVYRPNHRPAHAAPERGRIGRDAAARPAAPLSAPVLSVSASAEPAQAARPIEAVIRTPVMAVIAPQPVQPSVAPPAPAATLPPAPPPRDIARPAAAPAPDLSAWAEQA